MNLKTLGSYAWRIIKFILLGLCLILPQQVFALPYVLPKNYSPLTTNILMWSLLLLGYALMIVIFNWQFKKGQTPNKIFQKLSNQDINAIITGFIALFIIKIIYAMFMSQVGQTQNDQALQQMFKLSTNAAVMMFLMTAIFAPLCEELLFRGIFMRYFFPKNTVLAIFFSGLVFANILVVLFLFMRD
ncbi:MAG: CPBP family intramembrane metalloprotease [Helicobacter sp.]|nr:CPBP family intramembrane metalloprotease [Helicobacter sp.]